MFGLFDGMMQGAQAPGLGMQQAQNPGLFGDANNFISDNRMSLLNFGLGLMSGDSNQAAFQNAMRGVTAGSRLDREARDQRTLEKTLEAIPENLRPLARLNPGAYASAAIQNQMRDPMREYREREAAARAFGLDPNSDQGRQFVLGSTAVRPPTTSIGSPIWGTRRNADGTTTPVLMQPRSDGSMTESRLPEGVTPERGNTQRVDLGTHWGVLDATGNLIGRIPKNTEEEARQRATGTAQGTQQVESRNAAPSTVISASTTISNLDALINDPNLGWSVGWIGAGVNNSIPGSPGAARAARIAQAQGNAFIQAFESLKGGGAITQIEGEKATAAIGRLQTAQSEEAFRAALRELRQLADIARQRALQRLSPEDRQQLEQAGVQLPGATPSAAPAGGARIISSEPIR